MRKAWSLVGGLLLSLVCIAPVRAQLPPGLKPLEALGFGVETVEEFIGKGKKDEARFIMLGMAPIIQRSQGRVDGDLLPRYEKAMNTLWEPLTEANAQAAVDTLKAVIKEYEGDLTRYAIALDLFTPKDSMSFDQYANFMLKARECYPQAEACGVAYAAKAPSPLVHLKLATQTSSFQMVSHLQRILFNGDLWEPFLQKDVLPRAIKKAEEALAQVKDDHEVHVMMMQADEARKMLGYVLAIDAKNPKIAEVNAGIDALLKKAEEKIATRTAENRMPGEGYKENDADALRAQLSATYQAAFPKEKLVKLVIRSSNWVETAEAWWEKDVLRSGIFRWIEAAAAVQGEKDGEVRVFYVRFGRQWSGTADKFGEPYYNRTSLSYNMLRANL